MSQPHSYYDWQLNTLLLAYDAVDPISRHDDVALAERQKAVEEELHELADAVIPQSYKDNPQQDFPADIVIRMTVATIARASVIIGLVKDDEVDDALPGLPGQ
jgi:hypothetical protein